MEDCFLQINYFWNDSTEQQVASWTEKEFSGRVHMRFGLWMRNNWRLWRGSRLSKYFNDMGINHADDMSGIILTSYHRKLTGTDIQLKKQVKYYQNYWKRAKKKGDKIRGVEFKEFTIGDTVDFLYNRGFVSENQDDAFMNDTCIAAGIIKDKKKKNFKLLIVLLDACDPEGIVISHANPFADSGAIIEENQRTTMNAGDERWTEYNLWEPK